MKKFYKIAITILSILVAIEIALLVICFIIDAPVSTFLSVGFSFAACVINLTNVIIICKN